MAVLTLEEHLLPTPLVPHTLTLLYSGLHPIAGVWHTVDLSTIYLVVLHLNVEPTHPHGSGCGSKLAGRSANGLVVGWRVQDLQCYNNNKQKTSGTWSIHHHPI